MTRTTMGNLINLSVNITRVTTDLLERFTLEFIPEFFSEKRLVVSDIENCTPSSSEDRPSIFFEDEDRPLFI